MLFPAMEIEKWVSYQEKGKDSIDSKAKNCVIVKARYTIND